MATEILIRNNAVSTLLAGITSGALSLAVQSSHGARFSSPGAGQVVKITLYDSALNREIIHMTARSGDTMTIARGQEGTTPRAWNAGDAVEQMATAAFLNGLSQLDRTETYTAPKTFAGGIAGAAPFLQGIGPSYIQNIGIVASVSAKALTIALKTKALADASATDPIGVAFPNDSELIGDYSVATAIAATSIVVPSGATLGFAAAEKGTIYVYAINNAGTIALAVSKTLFQENSDRPGTGVIDTASDTANAVYSTVAKGKSTLRPIGRIDITTGAVAGEWDNAPAEVHVGKPSHGVEADGYTRITPNLYRKTTFGATTQLSGVALVSAPVANAKGMIIWIRTIACANAGALRRYSMVEIYKDGPVLLGLIAQARAEAEETVAAGYFAGATMVDYMTEVHVYQSSVYLSLSRDAGNQGLATYNVVGYYV